MKKPLPANEVATIAGHPGTPAWLRDDVMGIAALHPSVGLNTAAGFLPSITFVHYRSSGSSDAMKTQIIGINTNNTT